MALKGLVDLAAVGFGVLTGPILRLMAQHRTSLPRFQQMSDRLGFQLRSTHYYEPTYAEHHLPSVTTGERKLPGVDLNEDAQLALLSRFRFRDELEALPVEPAAGRFGYANGMFSYGDAEIYYNFIRLTKPRRIVEIGCGNSTLLALEAIARNKVDDPAYACDLTCIEPYEMPWLEGMDVRLMRERVEHVDLAVFDRLEANDILFIDSSHVIRPHGDVLREFQEIIPQLRPGVLIHVHDIFTPRDYPEAWLRKQRKLWNEQYLLESFLAFNTRFEIICAVNWLRHNHFDELVEACPMLGRNPKEPGSFWFRAT